MRDWPALHDGLFDQHPFFNERTKILWRTRYTYIFGIDIGIERPAECKIIADGPKPRYIYHFIQSDHKRGNIVKRHTAHMSVLDPGIGSDQARRAVNLYLR